MREITKSIEYSSSPQINAKINQLTGLDRYGTMFYFLGAGLIGIGFGQRENLG